MRKAITSNPWPTVLGHESAGIVEAVGSEVRTVRKGDHVITCLSAFCGHCNHCLTGDLSLCVSPEVQRPQDSESRLGFHQYLNMSSLRPASQLRERD